MIMYAMCERLLMLRDAQLMPFITGLVKTSIYIAKYGVYSSKMRLMYVVFLYVCFYFSTWYF